MGFMARAFAKGQTTFQLPADEDVGEWVGGRWVPGETPEPITETATILPLTSYDLQYYEGGKYTTEDVKVIVEGRIDLPVETTFEHKGSTYSIGEERDYDAVANLRRYVGKKMQDTGGTP